MTEQSKITIIFNWLADHPKTLRYLADNPGILKFVARYGDNIDTIIKIFSRDAEAPIKPTEITGIGFKLTDFIKGLGLGSGIGFLMGKAFGNPDNEYDND